VSDTQDCAEWRALLAAMKGQHIGPEIAEMSKVDLLLLASCCERVRWACFKRLSDEAETE
jgi:hypothetical protein